MEKHMYIEKKSPPPPIKYLQENIFTERKWENEKLLNIFGLMISFFLFLVKSIKRIKAKN